MSLLTLFLCSSLLWCGARVLSAGGKSLREAGEQRGNEIQDLRTEVKERRSGEVGVGMMRKEGHLAAVAGPQMAEGNVPCHREMEYPQ